MNKMLSMTMAALLAGTVIILSFSDADARHRRRGYGGAVAAGVIGGAILGAAIANSNRHRYRERRYRPRRVYRRRYGDPHINWCYSRYRSYRAYDNTYQPYRGGRRYCRSPYG